MEKLQIITIKFTEIKEWESKLSNKIEESEDVYIRLTLRSIDWKKKFQDRKS